MQQLNPQTGPVRLSNIAYYIPPKRSSGGLDDPEVIIIFGWMGATFSQLMKHSAQHSKAYPAAAQVIIQSDIVTCAIGSKEVNVSRQRPVVEKLTKMGLFDERPPRLLLHVFSGGGAGQLCYLGLALRSVTPKAGYIQPTTCLILDSSPGAFYMSDLQRATTFSLTGFSRLAGTAAASLMYMVMLKAAPAISGRPTFHDFVRDGLNNAKILYLMDRTTPRLYLYSDTDQVCLASDVKSHIAVAKEKGLNVREEGFSGSQHVLHARLYPERYWHALHSTWRDAVLVRSKL
ncbi:hypothetical protein DFH09DRAFT_1211909 [Mycena vulgaris]|nr:hypothetical protein DFH09DRAFT_1211909 [Mycena vulgaris]